MMKRPNPLEMLGGWTLGHGLVGHESVTLSREYVLYYKLLHIFSISCIDWQDVIHIIRNLQKVVILNLLQKK